MSEEMIILMITAVSLGFFHTLFGPDHYVPFIVMSKARKWSILKTSIITVLCGFGHIMSSVLLGIIGILFGLGISQLEGTESFRGNLAGWLFIAFGLAYFIWGIRRAIKNKPHKHLHSHGEDEKHEHEHGHSDEHAHVHAQEKNKNITPWVLFVIFVLGPCEPLIPVLMYPAAKGSVSGVVLVTGIFGLTTIITMLSLVLITSFGINLVPLGKIEKYTHAIAGFTIFLSGAAIQFLGL